VINLTAGLGDGTASSGFRFRAQTDSAGDGSNVPVFDVMYDDRKVFEINPAIGNVMLGNYNEATKSGGILYDYVNDKLLGNVAYDQWDLVVESDSDLAFLNTPDAWITGTAYSLGDKVLGTDSRSYACILAHTSSATDSPITGGNYLTYWKQIQYSNVLITVGTFNISNKIDLFAYGVDRFIGVSKIRSILNIDYILGTGENAIVVNNSTDISNISIKTSATQINNGRVIYCASTNVMAVSSVDITGFNQKCYGLYFAGEESFSASPRFRVTANDVYVSDLYGGIYEVTEMSYCYAYNCSGIGLKGKRANYCTANTCVNRGISCQIGQAIGCYAYNCTIGIVAGNGCSTCMVSNCDAGFSECHSVTGCYSYCSGGTAYELCNFVSACYANGVTKFYLCNNVDPDSCNV